MFTQRELQFISDKSTIKINETVSFLAFRNPLHPYSIVLGIIFS